MKFYKNIKSEKGITGIDITISILMIAIFTAIVATLSYNIYVTSVTQKRTAVASNYLIDIFEYIDKIDYESVTEDNIISEFQTLIHGSDTSKNIISIKKSEATEELKTPYRVEITVENYNDTAEGKEDIIKTVTLKIKYNVAKKEEMIQIKRLKLRE